MSRRRARCLRGMSLIEVMVALLVFSFGVLGLVGMQAQAMRVGSDSEDRMRAAMIADELVSLMWTRGTTTIDAAELKDWTAAKAASPVFGLRGLACSVSAKDANGAVTIRISWTSPHGAASHVTRIAI